jgi:uncharacterized protein YuzE
MLSTTYDGEADALYISLRRGAHVARTEELDDWTLVDVDARGSAVGIEVIHPARAWPVDQFVERYKIEGSVRELLLKMVPTISDGRTVPFGSPDLGVDTTARDARVAL